MTLPGTDRLFTALEHTWPPAVWHEAPPWRIAEGRGGGKRVSAARPMPGAILPESEITVAEAAMDDLGQTRLFQIRSEDEVLDTALAARGYDIIDPTVIFAAPADVLSAKPLPPVSAFLMPEPLAIMRDIWAAGGVGPARLAVMARAGAPQTMVLGRTADRAAGCAFAALHDGIAMIHAIDVLPGFRRKGTARNMITALAQWARDRGAAHVALAVTASNSGAHALYRSLGMSQYEGYHYRIAAGGGHR